MRITITLSEAELLRYVKEGLIDNDILLEEDEISLVTNVCKDDRGGASTTTHVISYDKEVC